VEAALEAMAQGAGDGVLSYAVGDEFRGATEFTVGADGAYRLRSTRTADRAELTFEGRIEPERVRAIAAEWREARVWQVRHVRAKPGDDDPPAVLALEAGGGRSEVVLWVSEVPSSDAFGRGRAPLLALIEELSDGRVLEYGR
jgi:hypothetical protein